MTAAIDLDTERALRAPRENVAFVTGDHAEMACALLAELGPPEFMRAAHNTLYSYDERLGIWQPADRSRASIIVQSFSGRMTMTDPPRPIRVRASDVAGAIQLAQDRVTVPEFFDKAPHGLAFSNGFVRLVQGQLRLVPHSPSHGARYAYPFACDDGATCPQWEQCLLDAFRGDADAGEKIAAIQEYAGASLLGFATRFTRAIVMYGNGANAKSVVAEVIASAFPPGSTCAIPPQTWGNEYRLALLAGKLFNVVNELPEADILAGETFKGIVDGNQTTARPIREAPFDYHPRAGHLFAANRLPQSNDQSHGFWRRMMVIEFNRTFATHEQDTTLADRIIREETPGIVAWMLAGARRAILQGQLTIPPSSVSAVRNWQHASDPISLFVAEKTRRPKLDETRSTCAEVFDAYATWAEKNRFKVMSSASFGRRMSGLGFPSEAGHECYFYPVRLLALGEKPDPIVMPEDKPSAQDPAEDWTR